MMPLCAGKEGIRDGLLIRRVGTKVGFAVVRGAQIGPAIRPTQNACISLGCAGWVNEDPCSNGDIAHGTKVIRITH